MNIVAEAEVFARKAHAGLVRPNKAQTPYHEHLAEVAQLATLSGGSEIEIAAAWLHDTVEDTGTNIVDIQVVFGNEVADIVLGLTDDPNMGTLPTLERKYRQADNLRSKTFSVRRVKLCDGISNLRSVAIDPPVKWNQQTMFDYITGCAAVAYQCRGISSMLEVEFYEAYRAAMFFCLAHKK
jgi:GTP diphosphokinase / guanosine-3',5'-bis(diphosphate) 3'-diphosphatase